MVFAFTQTGSAFILIGSFFGAAPSNSDDALHVAGGRRVDLLAGRRRRRRRGLRGRARRFLAAAARDERGRERESEETDPDVS